MEIARYILMAIIMIVELVLIVLVLMQSKEDQNVSATLMGASTNNFYEKNKGRTKEGKLKRRTGICIALIFILALVLDIIYVA